MNSLPSPKAIKEEIVPLHHKESAREIVLGRSDKRVVITGPCSVHDPSGAIAYARRLQKLAEEVPNCLLVMRVYVEKPRTRTGWKGYLYAPHPEKSPNLALGLIKARSLFTTIAKMGVPIATEFVDPLSAFYLADLVTWGFIGARTSFSQPHRQIASMLDIPVGFKNCTTGSISGALNGIAAAKHPQSFLGINSEGRCAQIDSHGNPYAHLVLRGSDRGPNIDLATDCPVLIDCSHGNSARCHYRQEEIAYTVIEKNRPDMFGIMLESHVNGGRQDEPLCPNTSITDACIDWETTEKIIHAYSSRITENQSACVHSSTTSPLSV